VDEALLEALSGAAARGIECGREHRCLSLAAVKEIAERFGLSTGEVSAAALENGFLPWRYSRNIGVTGLDGQARLLRSKVAVVGAGGIGGHASELLARMGVGTLVVIDPDVFEETNLNRQNFACEDTLGLAKVDVVLERILEINCDVSVEGHQVPAGLSNLSGLLEDVDVVLDALDSLDDRVLLQRECGRLGLVMVHGAIAGLALQATTVYPGDPGILDFAPLPQEGEKTRGVETLTGNPATTPALVAAIQVAEVVKVVTGQGCALRGRLLYIDTEDWTVEFIELAPQ
jgi:molybdopterin/thiamine biosynthesis adenylyltransferase